MITFIGSIINSLIAFAFIAVVTKGLNVVNVASTTFGNGYYMIGAKWQRFAATQADVPVLITKLLPFGFGKRTTCFVLSGSIFLALCFILVWIKTGILGIVSSFFVLVFSIVLCTALTLLFCVISPISSLGIAVLLFVGMVIIQSVWPNFFPVFLAPFRGTFSDLLSVLFIVLGLVFKYLFSVFQVIYFLIGSLAVFTLVYMSHWAILTPVKLVKRFFLLAFSTFLGEHKNTPSALIACFDATQSDNAKGVRINNSTLGLVRQLFRLSRTDIIAQMG